jgi:HK97 family phage portal protein
MSLIPYRLTSTWQAINAWLDQPVGFGGLKAATSWLAVVVPTWQDGQPVYSEQKFANYVTEGYERNELIYACLEAWSDTAAACTLQVKRRGDKKTLDDHPLRLLLERPNPFMSEADFWGFTLVNFRLAGVSYWLKVRSAAGIVVGLWPLRPDWMAPVASRKSFIDHYEYQTAGGQKIDIPAQDVLCFARRSPLNLYQTVSALKVISRVGDVDNTVTDFLKKFFDKGAMPPGNYTSKLKLRQDDIDRILKTIEKRYGGAENWHKPMVLDSDATYQRTGLTFEEMGFESLDARNEARICMVLKVPPIIIGAKLGLDKATYSNYGEARLSWWEDRVFPTYRFLETCINSQLAPEFGTDLVTEWDYSRVPAFQEKRTSMFERMDNSVRAGWITVNEARKEVGYEEMPGQDVFLRGNAAVDAAGSAATETAVAAALPDKQLPYGQAGQAVESELLRKVLEG